MQQIIKGGKSLFHVPRLLKERGVGQVLLVTGRHLAKEEAFAALKQQIAIPFTVAHPPEGLLQLEEIPLYTEADGIVAIGGGKVIDYAKGIIHRSQKELFFIAAPTTAGSGSEATPFAVFYSGKEKVSLESLQLLPRAVVLDPTLISHAPPWQKAISGADAFAQCIESIWNVRSNDCSEKHALQGLTLAWAYLPSFVAATEENGAEKMLEAAHLSGKAIAHTRTTGPHALSYYLTAHHAVPHGQAVALFLPLFFLYNDVAPARAQLQKIYRALQVSNADEAFTACRRFFSGLGLATTVTELGIEDLPVDDLLRSVNHQRFGNNPASFDAPALKDLIQRYLL